MGKTHPKMPADLKQLIAKGEGLRIEIKETPSEDVLNQFSKSCASFANAEGGNVVIGVNKRGKAVGANIDEYTLNRISQEAAACKPPVKIETSLYQDEQKTLLVVSVPRKARVRAEILRPS